MMPTRQTKFGQPDGNCFQACLASIFEIPIDDIPTFGGDDNPKTGWYYQFEEWSIDRFGLQPIDLMAQASGELWFWIPRGHHIINGMGPRGLMHSVVGRDGKMVFDPHPDDAGLEEIESFTVFVKVM